MMACQGGFVSPDDTRRFLDSVITSLSPRVYAVTTTAGGSNVPYFPQGAYSVFVQTTQEPGGGRILWVSREGRIVAVTTGCLRTAAQLYEERQGPNILVPPP
jgi:hypothetical protein